MPVQRVQQAQTADWAADDRASPSPRHPYVLMEDWHGPSHTAGSHNAGLEGEAGARVPSHVALPVQDGDRPLLQPVQIVPTNPRERLWFYVNHALDFFVTAGMLVVYAVVDGAEPKAGYMVFNTLFRHSYPYKSNTVPSLVVPIYSIGGPLVAFLVWKFAERRRLVTWYDFYRTFLSLLFVCFLTGAVTSALKVSIARPRPNFYFQCWPNGTAVWENQNQFGGYPQCAVPASEIAEYRKSFPSGHSSFSAAGCGYLTFWLFGQLQVFVRLKDRAWAFTLAIIPFIGACIVGVTRITDYWHNVADVCFGLVLGFSIALVYYLILYPFFLNPLCYVPRYVLAAEERAREEEKARA